MKKFAKVLASIALCFSLTGCFSQAYTRTASNELELTSNIKEVNDINSLVDNVETMMRKVNAISGSYELVNTKKTYTISFNAITKDERINWDLKADAKFDDKDVTVYLKDAKIYIVYPHNGANVIMKDSVDNFIIEAEETLDKVNATYNKDNLVNLVKGDKLEGFDFNKLKESATYVDNGNGTYTITFVENSLEWQYDVSSNYLITETRCSAINFNSVLKFNYPSDMTIEYPMGLDFLTVNLKDVKKMLEIESFSELLDK